MGFNGLIEVLTAITSAFKLPMLQYNQAKMLMLSLPISKPMYFLIIAEFQLSCSVINSMYM